jgi:5-carboxymethyl-2-hydroxymuconate isomerase
MKLVSFRHGARDGFGILKDDGVVDLTAENFFGTRYASLREVFAAGALDAMLMSVQNFEPNLGLTEISFLLPVPEPAKIICVGQNYYTDAGAKRAGKRPEYPNLFGRSRESFVPHGESIVRPKISDHLDYEGELGVIIGRQGRHIDEADALSHVVGYTCINEGSLRDWQRHGSQNFPGKNFRYSGAMGPCIATADEIPDPGKLTINTRVNGEARQEGGTGLMVFDISFLISYISTFAQLEPGDVISTGSPGDTAIDMDRPGWLKPGDQLEVEISGIGTLSNPVEAE